MTKKATATNDSDDLESLFDSIVSGNSNGNEDKSAAKKSGEADVEVFNEIGARIKSESPFKCTFIITHCNGAAGYLPTAESYPEGGYEVQSSSFAPEAAATLVKATMEMLQQLHSGHHERP